MYYLLIIIVILANITDLVLSVCMLTPATEGNLIASYLWDWGGVTALILMKAVVVGLVLSIIHFLHRIGSRYKWWVLSLAALAPIVPIVMFMYLVWEIRG